MMYSITIIVGKNEVKLGEHAEKSAARFAANALAHIIGYAYAIFLYDEVRVLDFIHQRSGEWNSEVKLKEGRAYAQEVTRGKRRIN